MATTPTDVDIDIIDWVLWLVTYRTESREELIDLLLDMRLELTR